MERFWVMELDDESLPFGLDTMGLVDEEEGGIILYAHRDTIGRILENMEFAGID